MNVKSVIRAIKSAIPYIVIAVVIATLALLSTPVATTSATSTELVTFLQADKTNQNKYVDGYKCVQFSKELIARANEQGIGAYLVIVTFSNYERSHVFVAFPTTSGTVYIEPQSDLRYEKPINGMPLCYEIGGICVTEEGVGVLYLSIIIENGVCSDNNLCG